MYRHSTLSKAFLLAGVDNGDLACATTNTQENLYISRTILNCSACTQYNHVMCIGKQYNHDIMLIYKDITFIAMGT